MKKFLIVNMFMLRVLAVFFSFIFVANSSADLLLAAPPRETEVQGQHLYQPIANQLSKLLGQKVIYQQPSSWFEFGIRMRSGMYDIVFDGPHFAAWRQKHLNHIPVVALPGELKFVVFVKASDGSVNNLNDLNGKVICGILSPNLGTNLIMSNFSSSENPPIVYAVTGDILNVYKNFKEGLCMAAILRDGAFFKLSANEQATLKIIHQTKSLPNQTITIGPKLKGQVEEIKTFMTSTAVASEASELLSRYSKKAPYFVSVSGERYIGLEKALEGVEAGW